MWLGEQITEKGIGNGISLIIFAGIVSQLPVTVTQTFKLLRLGEYQIFEVAMLIFIAVVVIGGVVYIQEGERRIPVQYAKRVIGRKMYGGQATHIPLKVNQSGVIPVIFATSILLFPSAIQQFTDNPILSAVAGFFDIGTISGQILQVILIIFFAYFYTAITVNPEELADNMKKNGGFIPGIRPGRPTAGHIQSILNKNNLSRSAVLRANSFASIYPFQFHSNRSWHWRNIVTNCCWCRVRDHETNRKPNAYAPL